MPWNKVFDHMPGGCSDAERLSFHAVDLLIPAAHLQYERIREAALASDVLEERIAATLDPVRRRELSQARPALDTSLLSDTWSLVTTAERLLQVVRLFPKDRDLRAATRHFEATLRPWQQLRRYVGRFDGAIREAVGTGQGALGSLAWHHVDTDTGADILVIIAPGSSPGTPETYRREQLATGGGPGRYRPPVDDFWLNLGEASYHLTGVHDEICNLEHRLRTWSRAFDDRDDRNPI